MDTRPWLRRTVEEEGKEARGTNAETVAKVAVKKAATRMIMEGWAVRCGTRREGMRGGGGKTDEMRIWRLA